MITHYGSAPDHTRPEGVDQVGDHISPRGAKVHGVGEACAKTKRSEKTDHFHVTSEARASCELAS